MCQPDPVAAAFFSFIIKKNCQPFINAHKKNLLHGPHYVRKTCSCLLISEIFHVNVFFCYAPECFRMNLQDVSFFLCIDKHFKGNGIKHAGRRKNADTAG